MNITVLISGGSRGLGLYLVKSFLAKGYNVATFSRNNSEQLIEITNNHPNVKWKSVDITDTSALQSFINEVIQSFGGIDILVNNTGYLYEGLLSLTPDKVIINTISTNITAPIFLIRGALKSMIRQKRGVILNISSINSVRGHKGVSIYSQSKAAIDGLTRSLAKELGPFNIRANSLVPGFFVSELVSFLSDSRKESILKRTPLKRLGNIEDIGKVALFLCSDEASFITGQSIIVDGGITC